MQRVVPSPSRILGETDNPEAAKRPQGVGVDSRISLHSSRRQLVDIALPLVVVATASHVGDFQREARGQLSLQCHVPHERHRVFQGGILSGNRKGEIPSLGPARRVRAAINDRELLHERRLSTLREIAVDASAIDELPCAGSKACLVVDAIGEAQSRLQHSQSLLSRREPVRQSVIHAGKISQERKFCQCFVKRRVSRHHDAVVSIPAHDETSRPVHDRRASRIVEVRLEHR